MASRHVLPFVLALAGSLIAAARASPQPTEPASARLEAPEPPEPVTAFVDVTVLPMTGEERLEHRTVVARGDRIESISPSAQAAIPPDAKLVDGAGRFLMPGLADLHVHLRSAEEFILYLANGVTTVRNLNGGPVHLTWRWEIEQKQELGPRIFTSGAILDGDPPVFYGNRVLRTVAEARAEVRRQGRAGYDAIKVYSLLPPELYDAVVEESAVVGLPVVGHVPYGVGVERALAAGQKSLEHLYGYVNAAEAEGSALQGRWDYRRLYGAVEIDPKRLEELAVATAKAGVWNCPTLVGIDHMVPEEEARQLLSRPYMEALPPMLRGIWNPRSGYLKEYMAESSPELRRQGRQTRRQIVRALHQAGARLLLGTDAGAPYTAPGFSIHEELQNLVDSGLTPYEAIRTGTSAAAEFLGVTDRQGTIEVGKVADLLLLESDPLESVAHLRLRVGVMARGFWLPETQLRQFLVDQAARFRRAP